MPNRPKFLRDKKKVKMYQNGNLVKEFDKMALAALFFKVDESTMTRYLKGQIKKPKWLTVGYILSY